MNFNKMAEKNVCIQIQNVWMVCQFNKEAGVVTPLVIRGKDGQETIPQSNLLVGKLHVGNDGHLSVEIKDVNGATLEVALNPEAVLTITACIDEPSRLVRP